MRVPILLSLAAAGLLIAPSWAAADFPHVVAAGESLSSIAATDGLTVDQLAAAGVRRISLATSLYRAAMTGFLDAVREVQEKGQFGFLDRCVTTAELNKLMQL